MKKRVLSLLIAFALVASLTACSGEADSSSQESNLSGSSTVEQEEGDTTDKADESSNIQSNQNSDISSAADKESSSSSSDSKGNGSSVSSSKPNNTASNSSSKPSGSNTGSNSSSKPNNGSHSGSSSSSKPSSGNSGSSSKPAEHQHSFTIWVPPVLGERQVSYTEKVPYTVDVPVYETVEYYQCNDCGATFNTSWDAIDHVTFECGGGYSLKSKQIQTGTEQETHYRDEIGYKTETYEKVPGYYKCSCGQHQK